MVVFCIRRPLSTEHIDAHVKRMAEVRGVGVEALAKYRNVVVTDLVEGARAWTINLWAANQVYIALGNFMTSAALLGVDTCPMEGFEPAKYDALLGLGKRGLASTVVCAAATARPSASTPISRGPLPERPGDRADPVSAGAARGRARDHPVGADVADSAGRGDRTPRNDWR